MSVQMKWFVRLGLVLMIFVVLFVFHLLSPIWFPILKVLLTVLIPFLIGGFFAYLLHPVVERFHETGMPRVAAILMIYSLFFGVFGFALYKGVPIFVQQLQEFVDELPKYVTAYESWITSLENSTSTLPPAVKQQLTESGAELKALTDQVLESMISSLQRILDVIIVVALIPFISFYLLKDAEAVRRTAWYITPKKWRREGIQFLRDIDRSLGQYIRGQLLVCSLMAIISTLLLWWIGLPYPLLFGLLIGVTNVIPYFGPVIGVVPAVIFALTVSPTLVLYVVLIIVGLQFLEGNVLSPLIVGKSLHMHPLMIMAALLIGGEIGGVVGLLLAVPVLAVTKVSLVHIRLRFFEKVRV
ncbi:AI-2E family transporter [Bacillus fonticola]|uniref:AI-2E family transporter n=1 Tax=Bacillus fonticola TaxID=2728853 RepID=UPI001474F630|nr:AI-2E family transporter [Bacillus fonticola]